ncbi:hypothetical protein pb186bvf_002875 [Paramecium bursaria]
MLGWENQSFQYTYIGNIDFQSSKYRAELKNSKYWTQIIDNRIIEYKFTQDAVNLGELLYLNQCKFIQITRKQSLQIIMMILKYFLKIRQLGLVHGQLLANYIWIEVKGDKKFSYLYNPDIEFGQVCFTRYQFNEQQQGDAEAIQKIIQQFDGIFILGEKDIKIQKEYKINHILQSSIQLDQIQFIQLLQSNIDILQAEVKTWKASFENQNITKLDIRAKLQSIVSDKIKALNNQEELTTQRDQIISFKSKYLFLKIAPAVINFIDCNTGSADQTIQQIKNYFDKSNQVNLLVQKQRAIGDGILNNLQFQNESSISIQILNVMNQYKGIKLTRSISILLTLIVKDRMNNYIFFNNLRTNYQSDTTKSQLT